MSDLVGWEFDMNKLRELAGVEFYAQIGPRIIFLTNRVKELEEHQELHDRIFARQKFLLEQLQKGQP